MKIHGNALAYVRTDRDYGEIAKLAVKNYGDALRHVPTDRSDYGEIAKLAVKNYGDALETRPDGSKRLRRNRQGCGEDKHSRIISRPQ